MAHTKRLKANADESIDLAAFEKDKIRGAIRTDFILSAEIVVISLGVMTAATFTTKAAALSAIAIMMTVGVYGLVALIVKLDDMGIYLVNQPSAYRQAMGRTILVFAPRLMKFYPLQARLPCSWSVVGFWCMVLVSYIIKLKTWRRYRVFWWSGPKLYIMV